MGGIYKGVSSGNFSKFADKWKLLIMGEVFVNGEGITFSQEVSHAIKVEELFPNFKTHSHSNKFRSCD